MLEEKLMFCGCIHCRVQIEANRPGGLCESCRTQCESHLNAVAQVHGSPTILPSPDLKKDAKTMETSETPKEESQVAKQKRVQEDKKRALSYLKSQVEELDRTMARNFVKGNYALASHDAKKMGAILDVLVEIDVTQS